VAVLAFTFREFISLRHYTFLKNGDEARSPLSRSALALAVSTSKSVAKGDSSSTRGLCRRLSNKEVAMRPFSLRRAV